MWSICTSDCMRSQGSLRGENLSVDCERVDRRVHACAMVHMGADSRSMRTVYGIDQLLKK